jgi:hypothetical protein
VAKLVLDHRAQRVDAPPHVLRIPGHEDPPHPGEVQHPRPRHANAVANNAWARSGGTPAVNVHRRPDRVVNVIRRRRRRPRRRGDWTTTSMKPGIRASWAPDDGYEGGRRTDTVLLAAAGNNFRIWLRLFCVYWESTIESFILATWALLLGLARSARGPLARG